MTTSIPIFPLRTVLFPDGPLQLRIFEPRYLDMVSQCLRDETGFGVCLIAEGSEVGQPAKPYRTGTLARIVDWQQRRDGLLGITALGQQRFRIQKTQTMPNRLLTADVEILASTGSDALPPQPTTIHNMLERILELEELGYAYTTARWDSAHWLSCRLAEILPLEMSVRQQLLEMDAPHDRLRTLSPMVPSLVCD